MNRRQRRASWLAQHHALMTPGNAAPSAFVPSTSMISSSSGRVHIEELVLHGFPATSGASISEATQDELKRILTVRGLPSQMMQEVARVDAGKFQLPTPANAKTIGGLVGRAVYGGLKR